MVARVKGSDRYAVHRTYLKLDGSGKANVEPPKAMLGKLRWRGLCGLIEAEGPLVVAEGIETALSLAQRPPAGPCHHLGGAVDLGHEEPPPARNPIPPDHRI